MRGDYYTKDQRKRALDSNMCTNFTNIQNGAFESPTQGPDLGSVPHKGQSDTSGVADLIKDLKSAHFTMGKDNSGFNYRTNTAYGTGVASAKPMGPVAWASQASNFALGTDRNHNMTDYRARFANVRPDNHGHLQKAEIAKKMQGDSVTIGGGGAFEGNTTTKAHYKDTFKGGRAANPPMDPLMESFIKGSHFTTGTGIFGGKTEQ